MMMMIDKVDFHKLNTEVQEQLDQALVKFHEMKIERDEAIKMLKQYRGIRARSMEGKVGGGDGDITGTYLNHNIQLHKGGGGDDDGQENDDDDDDDEYVWTIFDVVLKQNGQGFGLTLMGGSDEPYFNNGDPSLVVTDVIKTGPAYGKLRVGDQIQSINDIPLENTDKETALSIFRESGYSVSLVVRRRVLIPGKKLDHPLKVTLVKKNKKDEFGLILGFKTYVRRIIPNSLADMEGNIRPGDTLLELQNIPVDSLSFNEILKHVGKAKDKLKMIINKKIFVQGDPNNKFSHTRRSSLPVSKYLSSHPPSEFKGDPPRLIALDRDGGRGITLAGGNKTGIFVRKVYQNTNDPQQQQQLGLKEGDLILKMDDTDMFGRTREEAMLLLLSSSSQVEGTTLLVQHRRKDYNRLILQSKGYSGDLFYVRSNFNCESSDQNELNIHRGDVYQVVDTIPLGGIGSWRAVRVTGSKFTSGNDDDDNDDDNGRKRKGIIPNMNRAQQMALTSLIAKESKEPIRRGGANPFKKRPKSAVGVGGSFSPINSDVGLPLQHPYDKVALKKTNQRRPVVLCGVLSDIVSMKLILERPERFEVPEISSQSEGTDNFLIKYSDILSVIAKGKYALMNVDAPSIERLWRTDLPPIVICLKADNKQVIREVIQSWERIKSGSTPSPSVDPFAQSQDVGLSPKKIMERFHDFEKLHGHLFSCVMPLTSGNNLIKAIEGKVNELQTEKVWINEVLEPMDDEETLRIAPSLSFINNKPTSPQLTNEGLGHNRAHSDTLTKSSSENNIVKPSRSAIRYLPSYSTVTKLKHRKGNVLANKNSGDHNVRTNGVEGNRDHKVLYDHQDRSLSSSALPPDRERTLSRGEQMSKPHIRSQSETHHENHPSLHQSSDHQKVIFTHQQKPNQIHQFDPIIQQQQHQLQKSHNHQPQQQQIHQHLQQQNQQQQQQNHHQQQNQQHQQNLDDCHLRRFSNTYYPVFSSQINPTNHKVAQNSPEGPQYNQLTHPLRQQLQHPDIHHGISSNNTTTINNGDDDDGDGGQSRAHKRNGNYSGILYHHPPSKKSFSDGEKMVKFGEMVLKEIPINYEADNNIRSVHDNNIQLSPTPQHLRSSSCSSSSSSVLTSTRRIHHPPITSPHLPITSPHPFTTSPRPFTKSPLGQSNGVVDTGGFKTVNNDEVLRKPKVLTEKHLKNNLGMSVQSSNMTTVTAQARGIFNCNGGILDSKETGVKIVIPKGALPSGVEQDIFFKVCKDTNNITPLDKTRGESLLSPLVMCGPQGLKFLRPVELHIPHTANIDPDTWSFSIKSTTDSPDGDPRNWHQIHLENNNNNRNDLMSRNQNTVSFLVNGF